MGLSGADWPPTPDTCLFFRVGHAIPWRLYLSHLPIRPWARPVLL